jgi:hypothetical protein
MGSYFVHNHQKWSKNKHLHTKQITPFGPLDSISSVLDFPLICLALWWLTPLSIVQLYRGENLRPVASH